MKKRFLFILLIVSMNNISAQHTAVKNINNLSFKLLQRIRKTEGNKNILLSAYSINNALALTYLGAKNETKTEMQQIIFPYSEKNVPEEVKKLNDNLSFNRNLKLYSANNIWINEQEQIKKRFAKDVQEYFGASIQKADFSNKENIEKTRQKINFWVEQKTENKIKDFIEKGVLDESTVIVLVNAIYFYAKWKFQFDEHNTFADNFYDIYKNTTQTDFMHSVLSIDYYNNQELAAISIPYEHNEASLIIVLPDDFISFVYKMDNNYFEKILSGFQKRKVNLSIPKFKQQSNYDLIEYFRNMGLVHLFSNADLSGISGTKDTKVSNIIHQAVIDINESGTEASAATAVIGSRSVSANNEQVIFNANRPFFYFVRENNTGTLLFSGLFLTPPM